MGICGDSQPTSQDERVPSNLQKNKPNGTTDVLRDMTLTPSFWAPALAKTTKAYNLDSSWEEDEDRQEETAAQQKPDSKSIFSLHSLQRNLRVACVRMKSVFMTLDIISLCRGGGMPGSEVSDVS